MNSYYDREKWYVEGHTRHSKWIIDLAAEGTFRATHFDLQPVSCRWIEPGPMIIGENFGEITYKTDVGGSSRNKNKAFKELREEMLNQLTIGVTHRYLLLTDLKKLKKPRSKRERKK